MDACNSDKFGQASIRQSSERGSRTYVKQYAQFATKVQLSSHFGPFKQ